MNRFFPVLLFLCFSTQIQSQTSKSRGQYLVLNFSQIRENINYGFVFSGPQLKYGRTWQWKKKSVQYALESQLGIAVLSEKGPGYDFHLSPVQFDYLIKLNHQLWIGPCLLSDYNYEFYPDLQVGHDFWFTHFSAGVSLAFQKAFTKRLFSLKCKSALFGFTSRTPDDFDALFFNLGVKYAINDLHKNMQFTPVNRYRILHFEASFKPLKAQKIDVSYLMDYMAYRANPLWTRLNFGLKLSIHSKNGRS